MCGIVGCMGNLNLPEKKAFRDMLLFDVVRGQDSTGIFGVPMAIASPNFTRKEVGHPMNLWDMNPTDTLFDHRGVINGFQKVLLGHNRAATMGVVNVDNAHPFTFGGVTGVHNGSLWDTYDLLGNHVVDSKCIYDTIEQEGIDYTWERINGAAALVWWDEDAQRLYMIRNEERPLYTLSNKARNALFWASEDWMILAAMYRQKIEGSEDADKKGLVPTILEPHHLYEFSITSTTYKLEGKRELKKRKPPTARGTTVTTRNMGGNRVGFKGVNSNHYHKKIKKTLINQGWAGSMKKADKELRGKEIVLKFCMSSHNKTTNVWSYWIIGHLAGCGKIELRPNTIADWEKWDAVLRNNIGSKVCVELGTRPRYKVEEGCTTYYASTDNMKFLRTERYNTPQSNVITLPAKEEPITLYRVWGGVKVPEGQFSETLKKAGGCCAHCDDVLSIDDHTEMLWAKKDVVICKTCSEQPYIEELLRGTY